MQRGPGLQIRCMLGSWNGSYLEYLKHVPNTRSMVKITSVFDRVVNNVNI